MRGVAVRRLRKVLPAAQVAVRRRGRRQAGVEWWRGVAARWHGKM